MKGVILAGGTGSRLMPLTKVTNKHLLPVANKPMIYYPIEKLIGIGIEEILIVTGVEHMGDVVHLLGSGREFGCRFTYKVQDEAGGIAQSLGLAEHFANGEGIVVNLGDNIFEDNLKAEAGAFREQSGGARILLKEVPDPSRFGVAELDGNKVVGIEEKPPSPKSSWAVTGIYFYDETVFEFIRGLEPSDRGELEITDVNNHYVQGGRMTCGFLTGWWSDAGTFESLARVQDLIRRSPVK